MKVSVIPEQLDVKKAKEFYMDHSMGFKLKNKPKAKKNDAYHDFDEIQNVSIENCRRAAISAVVPYLPQIGNYEEESNTIAFDIAFGSNIDFNGNPKSIESKIPARFDTLHRVEIPQKLDSKNAMDELTKALSAIIKKTIPLCNNNHNLFILFNNSDENDDKYYIDCGLYTANPNTNSTVERQFIINNFVLAHSPRKGIICLSGLDRNKRDSSYPEINMCNFTFKEFKCNTKIANIYEYTDDTARVWHGIFERVKRQVHGTICLIVDPTWKLDEDKAFNDLKRKTDKDKAFGGSSKMELSISLAYDSQNSDNNSLFEGNVDLFLSMLNFDGITVIDSTGRIRAYNQFCIYDDLGQEVMGGARTRAYNTLKRQDNPAYIGLYFQSQEGVIKFYKYKEGVCYSYFDPNIMAKPNVCFDDIKVAMKNQQEMIDKDKNIICSNPDVNNLSCLIQNMWNTHYSPNNFYKEPAAAKELRDYVVNNPGVIVVSDYQLCELISVAIVCLIGNSYGYSYDAVDYYKEILRQFSDENWKFFFEKKYYYLNDLMRKLMDVGMFARLQELMNDTELIVNIPEAYKNKIRNLDNHMLLKMYYLVEDPGQNKPVPDVDEYNEEEYEDKPYRL